MKLKREHDVNSRDKVHLLHYIMISNWLASVVLHTWTHDKGLAHSDDQSGTVHAVGTGSRVDHSPLGGRWGVGQSDLPGAPVQLLGVAHDVEQVLAGEHRTDSDDHFVGQLRNDDFHFYLLRRTRASFAWIESI